VTGHPMEHVRERLDKAGIVGSRDIQSLRDGQRVVIAGLVTVRQRPGSAKGTIFILLEDEWGFVNVIVSPSLVDRYNDVVKYARFIVVEGRFERDGGVTNVVGRRFRELEVEQLVYGSHDFH
jgi:error-prone DNA polymerase